MTDLAYITACGFIDQTGWGDHVRQTCWPTETPACPPRLLWQPFSQTPYDHFGRLDMLSQYVAVAAELALRSRPTPTPNDEAGIVLTSAAGSLAADLEFLASMASPAGASPTAFSYTLPSTAMAEVAIRHHMTGANLCLLHQPQWPEAGLWQGLRLVCRHEVGRCLCIAADAVPASALPGLPPEYRGSLASPYAHAFLVESGLSCGASPATLASLRVEAPQPRGRVEDVRTSTVLSAGQLCRFILAADSGDRVIIHSPEAFCGRRALIVTKLASRITHTMGVRNGSTC